VLLTGGVTVNLLLLDLGLRLTLIAFEGCDSGFEDWDFSSLQLEGGNFCVPGSQLVIESLHLQL
jgi:hypothetical protein